MCLSRGGACGCFFVGRGVKVIGTACSFGIDYDLLSLQGKLKFLGGIQVRSADQK